MPPTPPATGASADPQVQRDFQMCGWLHDVLAKSVPTIHDWKSAMHQLVILFGERFTAARG
ncbi:hypothetical protein [Cupriavidus sp. AcVe19-1a]|uniref:hypothetical protein n=1 Tax=Cupriavidus sp. AcVe19-1a TaxID=2821359 RepID=UPI001AE27E09|nr:hypothetical protein [Cupriavidus sp. AcVe19-1a]MBP0630402.1 hypothetical protein [Cupriavidus sp. AcVe19-1a]